MKMRHILPMTMSLILILTFGFQFFISKSFGADNCVPGSVGLAPPPDFLIDMYGLSTDDFPGGMAVLECNEDGYFDQFVSTAAIYSELSMRRGDKELEAQAEAIFSQPFDELLTHYENQLLDGFGVQLITPETASEVSDAQLLSSNINLHLGISGESWNKALQGMSPEFQVMQRGDEVNIDSIQTLREGIEYNGSRARGVAEACEDRDRDAPETPLMALVASFTGEYTNPDGATTEPNTDEDVYPVFPVAIEDAGNGRQTITFRSGDRLLQRTVYQADNGQFYWIAPDNFHYAVNLRMADVVDYETFMRNSSMGSRSHACAATDGVPASAYPTGSRGSGGDTGDGGTN